MNRVFACLIRFAVVLVAYALACLAASALLHVLLSGGLHLAGEERDVAAAASLVTVPVLALVIANLAFIPAVFVIVMAELLTWRGWLTYALAGGAIGMAVPLFLQHAARDSGRATDPGGLAAVTAAGILAGMAYWMIAGRGAGGWHAR